MNEESKKMIEWMKGQLSEPFVLEDLFEEAQADFWAFLWDHKEEIIELLEKKMTSAASTYGPPIYPQERIDKELSEEYIDILGWKLVGRWNEERIRREVEKKQDEENQIAEPANSYDLPEIIELPPELPDV